MNTKTRTILHDLLSRDDEYGIEISADDTRMLCEAINSHGDGDHPMADSKTLPFFGVAYVLSCLEKAMNVVKFEDIKTEDQYERKEEQIFLWGELQTALSEWECREKKLASLRSVYHYPTSNIHGVPETHDVIRVEQEWVNGYPRDISRERVARLLEREDAHLLAMMFDGSVAKQVTNRIRFLAVDNTETAERIDLPCPMIY